MTGGLLHLTSGEPIQFKDTYERVSLWVRASEVKAVVPHFHMQTWAGRTYATEDGSYIEYGDGLSVFVFERAQVIVDMLACEAA